MTTTKDDELDRPPAHALLADGTTVCTRPAAPGDHEQLEGRYEEMSTENLRLGSSRRAAGRAPWPPNGPVPRPAPATGRCRPRRRAGEGRLVGIVIRRDLLQVFLGSDAEIRDEVLHEVLGRTLCLAPRTVDVSVAEGVVTLPGQVERRSEKETAVSMARRIDGTVGVVDELTCRLDDARLRSDGQALHGVADDRPRRL